MSAFLEIMQQSWVYALGWTILHSLWQSAFIAAICAVVLFFSKQATANFRYLIALTGVMLCVVASVLTFNRYLLVSSSVVGVTITSAPIAQTTVQSMPFDVMIFLNMHVNSLVVLWLLGFIIYTVKILLEYRYCQHIKNTHLRETPEKWQHIFAELSEKVGIKKIVELRISELVAVPCVIGHLKPVVLIPLGLLLSMNQQQIEAILLHELGHVRRNDYLLAFFQAIAKTLFFFNPFLLWISNQMDKEREHACDDIAVGINQDPLLFANTLKEFADMNMNLKSAMNINGNKLLLSRVTRLFAKPQKTSSAKNSLLATLLVIATGGVVSLCVNADSSTSSSVEKTVTVNMKPLPTAEAFAYVLAQINQQCGTDLKLEPIKHPVGNRILNMESMRCSNAIRRLKGDVAIENVEVPKNGKLVNMKMDNEPIFKVIDEVNKQCGTNATVSDEIRNELNSYNFQGMPCEKMIPFVQNYVPN